jgi:hypothetical protein
MRLKRLGVASIVAGLAALAVAVPAFAFDCNVAKKPTGAGSAAIIDTETEAVTPTKPNPGTEEHIHGGFITLDFGEAGQFDTFVHAHQGVLPPVQPGGPQDNCDGKGLESIEECLGG